jgi:hypothetical protein
MGIGSSESSRSRSSGSWADVFSWTLENSLPLSKLSPHLLRALDLAAASGRDDLSLHRRADLIHVQLCRNLLDSGWSSSRTSEYLLSPILFSCSGKADLRNSSHSTGAQPFSAEFHWLTSADLAGAASSILGTVATFSCPSSSASRPRAPSLPGSGRALGCPSSLLRPSRSPQSSRAILWDSLLARRT